MLVGRSIMGKKDKTSENTKDKLSLVVKSGKYQIGKYSQLVSLEFYH